MNSRNKRHTTVTLQDTVPQQRVKVPSQSSDKQVLRPGNSNKALPDKQRSSGHASAAATTDTKPSIVARSRSSQAILIQGSSYSHRSISKHGKPGLTSAPVLPSKSSRNNLCTLKEAAALSVAPPLPRFASRSKNPGGYMMHRAEGMFDLSNIHQIPDYRGSVYDLLEEFQRQLDTSNGTSATRPNSKIYSNSKETELNSRIQRGLSLDNTKKQDHNPPPLSSGKKHQASSTRAASLISTEFHKQSSSSTSRAGPSKMESADNTYSLSKRTDRVTTDSEEELLAKILLSMSRSTTSNDLSREDESDYANLWDSESGATGSAFQANKAVMGSLMRKKVNQQSHDTEGGKVWRTDKSETSTANPSSISTCQFNMDKFKSLREKAENMDLTLADFFSDLKHSNSTLELSKKFSSTQILTPNDCKFKCHQSCEDLIEERCEGPKTEHSEADPDQWASSKHLRHDADDADSGYSGSGSAGFTLTKEEICSKIHTYNESIGRSSGAMTLPADDSDSFHGCINVCICIDRPINMSLSSRPTSIYEVLHRESELSPHTSPENTVTHEQLPHNAVVSLHTTSSNTASEVVGILLNKFKITDNPKSFALFEQTIQNEKEVKLRKVGDQERPLLNYLRWSTECNESKRFVLKENDSGDIMYEAFSIPELNNFLRVLEEEEAMKLREIQNKYQVRQKQLADRLHEMDSELGFSRDLQRTVT